MGAIHRIKTWRLAWVGGMLALVVSASHVSMWGYAPVYASGAIFWAAYGGWAIVHASTSAAVVPSGLVVTRLGMRRFIAREEIVAAWGHGGHEYAEAIIVTDRIYRIPIGQMRRPLTFSKSMNLPEGPRIRNRWPLFLLFWSVPAMAFMFLVAMPPEAWRVPFVLGPVVLLLVAQRFWQARRIRSIAGQDGAPVPFTSNA